jgi:hypothetical protein
VIPYTPPFSLLYYVPFWSSHSVQRNDDNDNTLITLAGSKHYGKVNSRHRKLRGNIMMGRKMVTSSTITITTLHGLNCMVSMQHAIVDCHTMYKVTIVVFFLLSDSPASEFYALTFHNTLTVPSS